MDETDAKVEIVPYDADWPARFDRERARLAPLLPGLGIHHIGSTAVPGLAAKPVVDLMVLVDDLDAPVAVLVEQAGYQFPTALNAQLTDRRFLLWPDPVHRSLHLHLVADAAVLARYLAFRDALSADPRLRDEYVALKRDLAARFADQREAYTAGKAAFVERVISGAAAAPPPPRR